MSELGWSDRELADDLEGLLDPDVAEALAAEVALDEALAARRAALAALLREPVALPRLALPLGLQGQVDARLASLPRDAALAEALEGEGPAELLERDPARAQALRGVLGEAPPAGEPESLPALTPPPGLLGRVLARLESEALVAAAPPAASASGATLDDATLAALLEGVLAPAAASAAERALGQDPAARARFEALRAVLGARETLRELPLPAGLRGAVAARLREEELIRGELAPGASLAVYPPAELLGKTLERLESAALVAALPGAGAGAPPPPSSGDTSPAEFAPAPRGLVLSFPRPARVALTAAAAAALLLVGVGLGSSGFGREAADPSLAGKLAAAEALAAHAAEAEGEARALRLRAGQAEGALAASQREAEAQRAALAELRAEARAEVASAQAALEEARAEAAQALAARAELRADLAQAQRELGSERALRARGEGAQEELRTRLAAQGLELAQVRERVRASERSLGQALAARQEAETQRALAEGQLEARGPQSAGLQVAGVEGVERWDPHAQAWEPLSPGTALPAGTIVRGGSSLSSLQVSGLLPFQLRSGVYVVRDGQHLDPLPRDPWGAPRAAPAESEDVLTWIERLQSDSSVEQSRAQRALRARFAAQGGLGAPPTTAVGWSRWYAQETRRR